MAPVLPDSRKIKSFRTEAAFAAWIKANHARETELWLKIHKKGSGLPTVTQEFRWLAGTDNSDFFWSHDSDSIGFFHEDGYNLRKVRVSGGPAEDICDVGHGGYLYDSHCFDNARYEARLLGPFAGVSEDL